MSQRKSRQDSGKFGLRLKLQFPNQADAKIATSAVLPEANAPHAKRSRTSIGIKNRIISINIRASDASALRASMNSCLGSIIVSKRILEVE